MSFFHSPESFASLVNHPKRTENGQDLSTMADDTIDIQVQFALIGPHKSPSGQFTQFAFN